MRILAYINETSLSLKPCEQGLDDIASCPVDTSINDAVDSDFNDTDSDDDETAQPVFLIGADQEAMIENDDVIIFYKTFCS